jgi:hypothetical protein
VRRRREWKRRFEARVKRLSASARKEQDAFVAEFEAAQGISADRDWRVTSDGPEASWYCQLAKQEQSAEQPAWAKELAAEISAEQATE